MVGTSELRNSFLRLKAPQMSGPLSTQRTVNSLNPTYRIPPESLIQIFHYICQSEGFRTKRTGFLATIPVECGRAIVALTHVCWYWRATLLSNPKFWITTNLTHRLMTSALLERSGSMPIIATYITPNPNSPVPSTKTLLPHFFRIQKVHVSASLDQLMGFLSNLRGLPTILEAVELEYKLVDNQDDEHDEDCKDGDDLETWKEVFVLPPLLRDAPSLRFLRFSKIPFSDCLLELHHLTHLELSHTAACSHDYLAIMTANPMLEVVILRGTRDEGRGVHSSEATAISLPRLRRLELYHLSTGRILRRFTLPPGTHLSCVSPGFTIIPHSDGVRNTCAVEKLQYTFSKHRGRASRVVSGFGPNGTFLLNDTCHHFALDIPQTYFGSLEELSIASADTGAGEGSLSLTFVDMHGYILGLLLFSFTRLRVLILQRVHGCEVILRLLCDPSICPKLNTVILANVQSHTTYWSSLVEMARVREQHMGSSDIHRVDISCCAEELPEPDQLAELRMHVLLVELKSWNCEVEELDWLNDSRFRNLGRL